MDKQKIVITINREYGSGGRSIGKILSKRLGISYYDDEIIKLSSEYSAVAEEYFRMHDEKPGNNFFQKVMGATKANLSKPSISDNITSPDNLFRFESEVIRNIANRESCIFIGRCADFVLDSCAFPEYISIFVYADLTAKIRRIMDLDGLETKEALEKISKIDKRRASYYKYYTGEDWLDMSRYDLPIKTSDLEFEEACDLILYYLKLRKYAIPQS